MTTAALLWDTGWSAVRLTALTGRVSTGEETPPRGPVVWHRTETVEVSAASKVPPVLLLRNIIPDTQVNVEGLLEGLTYIFRVAAENQAGPGKFSVPSDPKTAQSPICM